MFKNFCLLLLLLNIACFAQEENKFRDGIAGISSFGKPFWADMHSTLIRAEVSYATNSPDYDWKGYNTDYRPYIFSNLGADIPIWAGNFAGGKYGLSFTLPFMIEVWLDLFERTTAPVINTAYRFGAFDIGFIHRLEYGFIHNWGLKFSPIKHECTHIGDELTIRKKELDMPITRVNVSYNYSELIFTINDPDEQPRLNHGFKFGVLMNHRFDDGWYNFLDTEADSSLVKQTQIPFEFHFQYQFQSMLFMRNFQLIASAEYRLRERYKYPFSYAGKDGEKDELENEKSEDLINCFNFFLGIRYNSLKPNYFSKIGIGARYYSGLNPYGQFRALPNYRQYGLAILFE